MSDLGFNLTASEACNRAGGQYYAQVYMNPSSRLNSAERFQVALGKKPPKLDSLPELLEQVLNRIAIHRHDKLLGLSVLRLCDYRRHPIQQLERVDALAFALPDETLPIDPHSLRVTDGIGLAQCSLEGAGLLQPIIDFPTTQAERKTNPVSLVAEASMSRPGQPAYIALRGLERLATIEYPNS